MTDQLTLKLSQATEHGEHRSGWERRAGEVNRKADQIRAAWEAGDLQWQIRKWHQRELGIKTAN
jgi:hypothetical protein